MAVGGSPQIATAAIGLMPVISGVQGNIASQLAGSQVMSGADKAGRSIGSRLGSTITSALKTGLKVGGVVAGALGAITIKGGLDRALGIENARAMLGGLGHDTQSVEGIMKNALASVEGTAFGLDAAATTAAGAVAAGIKPGEQLEQTLTTVANVAAGAQAPLDEIGNIFNTVAAVGSAYTGDINMIAQRGIPIWQSLSDTLGVSQEEVKKMASDGKIDFATFEAAAKDAAGGVALAMGDTTTGTFQNMMAGVNRLGATFVTGLLPLAQTAFGGITGLVDAVNAKVGPFIDLFFERFGGGMNAGIAGFFDGLIARVDAFDPQVVLDFFSNVKGYVSGLDFSGFTAFFDSLGASMGGGGGGFGSSLSGIGASLGEIGSAAPELLASSLSILNDVLGFLADHSDALVTLLPFLVAGFVAFRISTQLTTTALLAQRSAYIATLPLRVTSNALLLIANALELANVRAKNRATAATVANTAATTTNTVASRARNAAMVVSNVLTRASAIATRAFGVALRFAMGPIGLIITGVTLLAAGLVYFFTQTEVGGRIWSTIWGWIKSAAAAVVDWFTGTALPILQAAWAGIAAGALWLYQNAILPAWNGIRTAIQVVGDWITGTLWPALQTAWTAIGTAAMWLWQTIIMPVWTGIRIAIAVAVTAILLYVDYIVFMWRNVFAPIAIWLYESVILPVWNGIKAAISAVATWIVEVAWPLIKSAWDAIAGAATWLYESVILPVWNAIKAAISAVVDWIMNTGWPALKLTIDLIGNVMKWLYNSVILPVWNAIRSAIDSVVLWFQNTAWPLINTVLGWIQMSFEGWKLILQAVWNFVKNNIINPVIAWFRDTAWPLINTVLGHIKTGFRVMRDSLKAAWDFVKNRVISPVVNWLRDTIQPRISGVTDNIKSAFDTMKEGIKSAWDAVKAAARTPVKFVVEDVYNDSLRSTFNGVADKLSLPSKWRLPLGKVGFADGGVMPGYTPGKDVHRFFSPTGGRLDLSGGEPILRPEAGRVLGHDWVHGINRAARSGGTGGVSSFLGGHQAFAGGGIWNSIKGIGGDTWDWITDKASAIAEAISDPFGVLTKLAGKATELIPGGGMMHAATVQAGKNAGEMLGDWLRDQLAPAQTDGGTTPPASARKGGGSLALAQQLASAHGLTMTSFRRSGARTAGSGSVSLHALGRAMDFSNSSGPTPQMMRFFNAMHGYRPTELLYSPAGGRQWRRWGAQQDTSGATKRGHYNHVHVGFKDGGVFGNPYLYDQGGEIPPGVRMVANRTNRPEKVLPPRESKVITDLGRQGGRLDESPVDLSDDSIERLADALSSRPNYVQIGTRQAGQLAAAGATAKRSMGGSW